MTPSINKKDVLEDENSSSEKRGKGEKWAGALVALCFIGGFACNVSDRGIVTASQAGLLWAFALIFGYMLLNLVGLVIWGLHAAGKALLTKAYALAGEDFGQIKLSKGAKIVWSIFGICFLAGFACNVSERGVVTAFQAGIVWNFALLFGYMFLNLVGLLIWAIFAGAKALLRAV